MWKCDYKLLKAQKQKAAVDWNLFISLTQSIYFVIVLSRDVLT